MIFTDTVDLRDLTVEALRRMDQIKQMRKCVKWLMGPKSTIIITRKWYPIQAPIHQGKYYGCTRRYTNRTWVIDMNEQTSDFSVPLMAHELTHVCGGNELDAEVVEHLVAKPGEVVVISQYEKSLFEKVPKGKIFTIRHKHMKTKSGTVEKRAYYDNQPLWVVRRYTK